MAWLDDRVSDLRGVLADVQDLDFWPPRDAAETLVGLVARAVDIATQPPFPDPEDVQAAAAACRMIGADADAAVADLERVSAVTTAVWEGETGNAFRTSTGRLITRSGTVGPAARGVEQALTTLATAMTDARSRHTQAADQLRDNLQLSWGDLWPWELVHWLKGVAEGVVHAIHEAIGAYGDAADAVRAARRDIVAAMDEIDLPDQLSDSPGISVVTVVNGWNDDQGPVEGSTLDRYDDAYDDLSPSEQQAVRDALANAGSDQERAWIMAGVAAGLAGPALTRYTDRLGDLTPSQLRDLDPTRADDGTFIQPDQTTCGSSTLVMSRMLNDPAYAMWVLTGYNSGTGETAPADQTAADRFADESLTMHDRTNAMTDRDGGLQFPWPEAIGTQPWAIANEMSADGGSGVPGTEYDVRVADPDDRGRVYDQVAAASEDGHTVPLYIGGSIRPGHVVLVTGSEDGTLTIYEPANGETVTVSRDDFVNGDLGVAGWDEPWFAVTPR